MYEVDVIKETVNKDGGLDLTLDVSTDLINLATKAVDRISIEELDCIPEDVELDTAEAKTAVFIHRAIKERIQEECDAQEITEMYNSMELEDDPDEDDYDFGNHRSHFVMSECDSGALKHLDSKLRIDLVPVESIEALAEVLMYGSEKYEERNWEKGIPYMTSYASIMRHLLSWAKGVDQDEESELLHLEHALTNIAMMVCQVRRGRDDLDDREY